MRAVNDTVMECMYRMHIYIPTHSLSCTVSLTALITVHCNGMYISNAYIHSNSFSLMYSVMRAVNDTVMECIYRMYIYIPVHSLSCTESLTALITVHIWNVCTYMECMYYSAL